jgi:hypothetical protein
VCGVCGVWERDVVRCGGCSMTSNHAEFVMGRMVGDGKKIVYLIQNWIIRKRKSNTPSKMGVDHRRVINMQ